MGEEASHAEQKDWRFNSHLREGGLACRDASSLLRSFEEGGRAQPWGWKGRENPEDAKPCFVLRVARSRQSTSGKIRSSHCLRTVAQAAVCLGLEEQVLAAGRLGCCA